MKAQCHIVYLLILGLLVGCGNGGSDPTQPSEPLFAPLAGLWDLGGYNAVGTISDIPHEIFPDVATIRIECVGDDIYVLKLGPEFNEYTVVTGYSQFHLVKDQYWKSYKWSYSSEETTEYIVSGPLEDEYLAPYAEFLIDFVAHYAFAPDQSLPPEFVLRFIDEEGDLVGRRYFAMRRYYYE